MIFPETCKNPDEVNRFTCPRCHADHFGHDGQTRLCHCGARLLFTLDFQPVAICAVIGDRDDQEDAA